MPDTVLRFLHLILTIILCGQYYYFPNFRDEGTETLVSDLLRIIPPGNERL